MAYPPPSTGRGVVLLGETAVLGDRVRIYQGVTLGARSFERSADGSMRRGPYKRHPTLEDDVVVYANATILGGDTVIGSGAVIRESLQLGEQCFVAMGMRVSDAVPALSRISGRTQA